jgi:galactokinase
VTAADAFRAYFGRNPDGVWSAPGRVNLIGEHTDYNGGFVLPFAIDLRTRVAVGRRPDRVLTAQSLQRDGEFAQLSLVDLHTGSHEGWAAYVFGTVWALRDAGHDIGGLDVVVDSDVPNGAGLSSSAALECAVALAALDTHSVEIAPEALARLAQRAENAYVGVPCGLMDQMAASVCRADHALFFDVRDDIREHVPFAPGSVGLALLVVDTKAHHSLASGEYAKRRRDCESAAQQLGVQTLRDVTHLSPALALLGDDVLRRRVRHVVTENDRVLAAVSILRRGNLANLGPLLTSSHVSLRDDYEVSCDELDATVEAALGAGALGARMTGGGFGGSAIVLVAEDRVGTVSRAVRSEFDRRGFKPPRIMTPAVASGAARER